MREFQDYTKEPRAARRRWWVWSLPVVLVALVLGGAALAFDPGGRETNGPERLEASPTGWVQRMFGGGAPLAGGPFNVLVLGVDTRPESEEEGSRSDTMMLVRVDPESGNVKLLSVPRDLLVDVGPGKDRINTAYNYGGIERAVTVFEDFSKIPVDHYAIVDFEGFEDTVDAMGGVNVDVGDGDVFPDKWNMKDGVMHLNGRKALMYARYRGTPEGDLDRIERQQRLVAALRSQALDWNIVKRMPKILEVADKNVQTDLGIRQGISVGRVLIRRGPNAQMTAQQLKGDPETLDNGDQVLIPDDEANDPILAQFR
jgi:polyisoprenyl-teichoic acid--peptidoglycan teichoic acid transferase